jgi:hypothetical protein
MSEELAISSSDFYDKSPSAFEQLYLGEILTNVFVITFSDTFSIEDASSIPTTENGWSDSGCLGVQVLPMAIITSQGCDLESDYRNRFSQKGNALNILENILLCQIDKAGECLAAYNEHIPSKRKDLAEKNKLERFHFLPSWNEQDFCVPETLMDFKKVYSVNPLFLYAQIKAGTVKRKAILNSPYKEDFSQRFHFFHQRIGLPKPYPSER